MIRRVHERFDVQRVKMLGEDRRFGKDIRKRHKRDHGGLTADLWSKAM
jgi:hypothetical protein